ncbi:MAG: serine hydrolase [Psychroserpens sp.]|uniref:serine hydrolase n=1 Tax=Psychroserpens sp. TaxID=2020870 RepID=UPI003C7356C0
MKNYCFLFLVFWSISCNEDLNTNPLDDILSSNHPAIKDVMDHLEDHEVQIKVTKILPESSNNKRSDTYEFQVDDNAYFYPASTVKFPIAVLALEKVNTIDGISSKTPYRVEGDSIFYSIREDITNIFVVSGNAAYNRLYEFLGRDYINAKLKQKGLQPGRISHRLESSGAENSQTKKLIFKQQDSSFYRLPFSIDSEIKNLQLKSIFKGKGYYENDSLINKPMDFSKKNYLPISTLHDVMMRVQFPKKFKSEERFKLNKDDQNFLLDAMKNIPRNAGFDESEYYDGYVKFFMFGDTKDRIPSHISISNKVGYAYGYLTDCAFIEDRKHDISFVLTATIHVNANGVFNDDNYEYETIGIPFLAEVGRQLHQYYIERKKDN